MQIAVYLKKLTRRFRHRGLQFTLSISFTVVAILCMVLIALLMYTQLIGNMRTSVIQQNLQIVDQMALNLNSYTRNMMQISNSTYYNVIKNKDLEETNLSRELNLLYEANRDSLVSVACFSQTGELVGAAPIEVRKDGVNVQIQDWFVRANNTMENLHFSTQHVQNIFENTNYRYYWVISLSRVVELTQNGKTSRGILLVDMNYSVIEQIFTQFSTESIGYTYLIDNSGEILYHPKQKLIFSGLFNENNLTAAKYTDGSYEENYDGVSRHVIVKTMGYTGWKIVSVIPNHELSLSFSQFRLSILFVIGLAMLLIAFINFFVSSRLANPLKKLDNSVKKLENGELDLDIYIGGSYEVEHLGRTIRSVVLQIRKLMDDIVYEQELKRKSEFNALQAQINPHFLYNTLDSIVWMIECGRDKEAISMVTALASLFRISLSKGDNIITIRDELQHANNYLHIQNIRYKNKFTVNKQIDPEILQYSVIKLIVQPLLENAIYHALQMMDGDGELTIRAYEKNDNIYIEVQDNGIGIPKEKLERLLPATDSEQTDNENQSSFESISSTFSDEDEFEKKGSSIGLKNVHQRIQLYYGDIYGLQIESEPDEGTVVRIHLPKITPKETRLRYEKK